MSPSLKRAKFNGLTVGEDYSQEELDFLKAIDSYKRDNQRPFPTWSEILELFKSLGYRKVAPATPIPGVLEALLHRARAALWHNLLEPMDLRQVWSQEEIDALLTEIEDALGREETHQ